MFGHVKIRDYICTRYPNHNLFTLRTNTYKNIEWSVAKWATFIIYTSKHQNAPLYIVAIPCKISRC